MSARLPRRALLAALGALPFAMTQRPRAHAQAARAGRVYRGDLRSAPSAGAYPVVGGRAGFVRIGRELRTRGLGVFSIRNANDLYVALAGLPAAPDGMPFLAVPSGVVCAESWGTGFGDDRGGAASFHADRDLADTIAALWQVPRRDRSPLGAGLAGTWRPREQPFRVGAPMPIALRVENRAAPVGVSVGGRQRGPRDNRFSFVVERGGVALPVIEAPDFGGIGGFRAVGPGAPLELGADLASWARIEAPGRYRVRCAYQAELVPGTESPSWPDRAHLTWDLTLTDTIEVTVAP